MITSQGQQTVSGRSHKPAQGGSIPPPATSVSLRTRADRPGDHACSAPSARPRHPGVRAPGPYHGDPAMQMLVVVAVLALAVVAGALAAAL